MEVRGRTVVILGGSGLVGAATARQLLELEPARLVVAGLEESEARAAVAELEGTPRAEGVEVVPAWGDIFLRRDQRERSRAELVADAVAREEVLEDLFGPLDEASYARSTLVNLMERHRPEIVVDCVNTATAIAYQDLFAWAAELRRRAADGEVDPASVERHLTTLYLPQLIRHVQLLLEALRRAGTLAYVKVGTTGTGGMGLNVPFTHSEERPSRTLLAKASVAGAHSMLLFLMGRTPGAPGVTEIKPAAAVAWKRIAHGPIMRGGRPIRRCDAVRPLPVEEAFEEAAADGWRETGGVLESVYLDAGENGMFSLAEFEVISALRMMELITPEEIAEAVVAEIQGRPTGRDIVAALDGAVCGPTYRAGMLREVGLSRMERLEEEHGVRSVAFEMLGPPRLSKLLFEGEILRRLHEDVETAVALDPEETAERALALVRQDELLRSDILSVGLPILLPDGESLLRGPEVKVTPPTEASPADPRWAHQGWVDLRADCWVRWRERCRGFQEERRRAPGPEDGSTADLDERASSGRLRPGALAAYVFRVEDGGERIKR